MTNDPAVSIVMPVRDESRYIEDELRAILQQDYPPGLVEVFVVDGGSADDTARIARSLAQEFWEKGFRNYDVLPNPKGTTPHALNIGIAKATGEVVMRVDGHSRISPRHVRQCVEALAQTGADNVGGGIEARGTSATGEAIALATTSPFGVGDSTFRHGRRAGWAQTVYPGAFLRSVFARIGVFDEELARNQDDEFNFRLIQSGGRIWFDPAIQTVHYARDSLTAHLRQHFDFGLYKVRVIQKRGAVPALRHLVPAGFVATIAVSAALSARRRDARYILASAGPYALANIAAAYVATRGRRRLLPRVSAAFVLMHTGYGLGFLAGLWRWRRFFDHGRA